MPTTGLSPLAHHRPLAELAVWVRRSLERFRALGLAPAVAREGITAQIVAECVAESAEIAALASSAESADREALRLIDTVLADGRVERAELPLLRRARAAAARSAAADHHISQRSLSSL